MSVYTQILEEIKPYNAQLVAVSKTRSPAQIMELYQGGQRIFGENRVQELVEKEASLPKDIQWQMIGHLQRNKVKYIAPFVHLIHSVDSLRLLKEINHQAAKNDRTIACLLEFKIGEESAKAGLSTEEGLQLPAQIQKEPLSNIQLKGVMGMASFTNDTEQVREEFKALKNIFDQIKEKYYVGDNSFSIISMGMSGDYSIALEEGSTMVRIGTKLFGR